MEEKSLRVYQQKTFFSKIGTTISKILIPTKIGFNGVIISLKRNNLLKSYEAYKEATNEEASKKEQLNKKYEDMFVLYLDSIDKFVMDSIYKKVKNGNASSFEEDALSKYYMITNLKDNQYMEYKYRKQKYLIELDYEGISNSGKEKVIEKYNNFYIEKMDSLYKGILKNYSVQLADNLKTTETDKIAIYDKIFELVEEYIVDVLTLKMKDRAYNIEKETIDLYDKYAKFLAGKLDSIDILEKKLIVLAITRKLFTHSLPLIIVEQCYEQLLNDARAEIVYSKNERKLEKAYKILFEIIEEFKIKLLSTKIYWEKPKEKDEYKQFWEDYKKLESLTEEKKKLQKEILFIKNDLNKIEKNESRYKLVIEIYKKKLVELGVIKELKNNTTTKQGKMTKKSSKTKNKVNKEKNKLKKEVKSENKLDDKEKVVEPKRRGRPRKNG